jgi:peptidoglycan/LPS O-acetylase OafA/YrhL
MAHYQIELPPRRIPWIVHSAFFTFALIYMASPADSRTTARVPEWDGIRGLAILLVVFYHYIYGAVPKAAGGAAGLVRAVFPLSWSGVDLFFVLSGFLIGGILMKQYGAENYFKIFYVRRVCRIIPLYFAWLILFLVLAWAVGSPNSIEWRSVIFDREIPHFQRWGYFLFLQNFFTAKTGLFGSPWLAPTWSLAVEEQFYLLMPLVLWFTRPNKRLPVLITLIVLVPLLRTYLFLFHSSIFVYVLLPCRADALLLGVLCAYLIREPRHFEKLKRNRSALAIAFIILALGVCGLTAYVHGDDAFAFNVFEMVTFGFTWIAMFYACLLLLVATTPSGAITAIFRTRLLQHFGLIAYGMFLMHMVINSLVHGLILGKTAEIKNLTDLLVTLVAFLATWFLAALSWNFFEQPIIRWGHSFRYCAGDKVLSEKTFPAVSHNSPN